MLRVTDICCHPNISEGVTDRGGSFRFSKGNTNFFCKYFPRLFGFLGCWPIGRFISPDVYIHVVVQTLTGRHALALVRRRRRSFGIRRAGDQRRFGRQWQIDDRCRCSRFVICHFATHHVIAQTPGFRTPE